MNKELVDKLITKLENEQDPALQTILNRAKSFKELMVLSENEKLEVIEDAIKDIVDEVTDDIIDDVVDEKIENKRKGELMKEHLKRLDMAMDHLMSYGLHLTKSMMETDDESIKELLGKMHSYTMKMAEMVKEKRGEMDPHGMYTKHADSYYEAKFGEVIEQKEDTEEIKILSEIEKITEDKGDRIVGKVLAYKAALDSVKALTEQLSTKDTEIKTLSEKLVLSEKERLVEDAIHGRNKKLLPKQKEWALSLSLDQLKSYIEASPTLSLSEKVFDVVKEEVPTVELSDVEKEFIKRLNLDEAKYKETKLQKFGK